MYSAFKYVSYITTTVLNEPSRFCFPYRYPVPHTLVLADRTEEQAETVYEDCAVLNPGTFTAEGSFAVYRPATREVELSSLCGEEAEEA